MGIALCPASVHPRLRGELKRYIERMRTRNGSSPLTRGTLVVSVMFKNKQRFIPAYAGNSIVFKLSEFSETVHPRLRGELNLNKA